MDELALESFPVLQDEMATIGVGGKIVVDVVCCIIIGIPILVLEFAGQPYRRGYFCDDDSIRLNYKDSTISSLALYFVGTLLPCSVIFILEGLRYRKGLLQTTGNLRFFGYPVHQLLYAYYRAIFFFGFGCLVSQLVTDIGKYSVGRLRPHFLDVCRSNYTCPVNGTGDEHRYVMDYICQGDADKVKDARLSFPSGHSSFSAYTMGYLALYLQFRFLWNGTAFLKPFLQFVVILIAYYTGLSRISDHKHHWSDVLSGALIGTIVAFITCFMISDLYRRRTKKDEDSQLMNNAANDPA